MQAGRIDAEEFPEHGLGTQRRRDSFEVREGFVRVGRRRDGSQQGGGNAGEELPGTPGGEKGHRLLREQHQVLISPVEIAEGIAAEHLLDRRLVRLGGKNEIGFRLGLGSAGVGERLVQKVIEDRAIDRRLLLEILQELIQWLGRYFARLKRRGFRFVQRRATLGRQCRLRSGEGGIRGKCGLRSKVGIPSFEFRVPNFRVAHPQGELSQLVGGSGQPVCLEIEEQLQAMLGLAEEAIRIREDVGFLGGEAACDFQGFEGEQRGLLADGGEIATVEELEELDGVLDVADAAAAGLHVLVVAAAAGGFLLHLAFQGLHLVDLGEAEILAVDERLDRLRELLAQGKIARDGPQLDEGLAFPCAAHGVVVAERARQRTGQRRSAALGTKPQVHAIREAAIREIREQADHLADEPCVILGIGVASAFANGLAISVVDEHQVDVAGIVEFLAAQLSEGEGGETCRLPRGGGLAEAGH